MENFAEIQAMYFPMINAGFHIQQITASDQIIKPSNAYAGHQLAHLFRNEEEEIHHMLWLACEFFTQYRVLRSDAHRAGIEMAFTHHDAALYHQRRRGETKLICPE